MLNFNPAFWEYEGAQAKMVVYYSRNELKILWEEPFTLAGIEIQQISYLQERFDRFSTWDFCRIFYIAVNFAYSVKNFFVVS